MNNYICFYRDKQFECRARTSRAARELAVKHFNVKSKPWEVTVIFVDKPVDPASL